MFCENCGRKSSPGEKYCADCGSLIRTTINNNVNPIPAPVQGQINKPKKKAKTGLIVGIILGVIALIVAVIVGIIAFAFSFLNKYETSMYIELDNDKIPTIYNAVGQKDLVSISFNDNNTTFEYYAEDFTEDELLEYFAVLENEDFSLVDDESNAFVYVKESVDSGKLLFVYGNRDYTDDILIFDYIKVSGDIEDYSLYNSDEDTVRVGGIGYGFLDVAESIVKYNGTTETEEVLQYSNEEESLLITLSSIKDSEYTATDYVAYYADDYEQEGATVELGTETVAGYNTYTIKATFEDGWITKEWLFLDEKNNLYYIYMGTYDDTYIFDYIESYGTES